jgi:hypothetical protein
MTGPTTPKPLTLEVVDWNGHPAWCIYLNSYRIAGDKPWAGGTVSRTLNVEIADLRTVLEEFGLTITKKRRVRR